MFWWERKERLVTRVSSSSSIMSVCGNGANLLVCHPFDYADWRANSETGYSGSSLEQ